MTVEHKILKNGAGETMLVKLTALSAIRKHCLECMGWSTDMVKECTSPLCCLYPFRSGKSPSHFGKKRKTSNKGIDALRKYREKAHTKAKD